MTDLSRIRHALFIRTDRLGETILNLPAMSALKAGLPQARLSILVQPTLKPLLQALPFVDEVMTTSEPGGAWWQRCIHLIRQLKPHHFDVAIISNPMKELHLATSLAGIPLRVGYCRKWGRLLTHRLKDCKSLGERHEVEYNLDLIETLGLARRLPAWQFPPLIAEQAQVRGLLTEHGFSNPEFIVFHPWSSNAQKEWSLERCDSFVREAVEKHKLQLVVIGGAENASRVSSIVFDKRQVAVFVGKLTLRQLAGLLQISRLLISTDSGPMHLAAAVGTPVLALFSTQQRATQPVRWGPWGKNHS
ncbi:MAG: glycosyltransferase family 9 protein, partial [Candidatus Omnitrophica bacterium]|nr:glycosyltransferase family 9 protein [Candidatus Omnitrophota bacterium]